MFVCMYGVSKITDFCIFCLFAKLLHRVFDMGKCGILHLVSIPGATYHVYSFGHLYAQGEHSHGRYTSCP